MRYNYGTGRNNMDSQEQILIGLNPEQQKAVTHNRGPLLVIAGAGTGKTMVITRRIARLIADKRAKPSEILALTFTDKAANEMESRVDAMVPYGYVDVAISTFHSFGDRILRDYAIDLGMRPDYRVLAYADQIVFFREHIHEFPLKYYRSLSDPTKHVEALISAISRAMDEDILPEEYIAWAKKRMKGARGRDTGGGERKMEAEKQLEVARVYKKYQELKAKKGFVDFGDQVTLLLRLFREHPAVLKSYRDRFKFIMVDEFQDTNYAQFELIKLLCGKEKNIMAVGDDDQSIYKFRGAAISNILNFEKIYRKTRKIVLKQNFRSTQLILDSAYRLIKHNNPDRLEARIGIDKQLTATRGAGTYRVEHKHFDRVSSEADWVARTISQKMEGGEFKLRDFAILVRANADAEPFRQSLNMLSLPYAFSGGGGLYVFPEVKLAVSFLKVIGDLADSAALYGLAVSELYRLDPLDLQKINTFADRRNYTLHHVFSHIDQIADKDSEFYVLNDLKEGSVVNIKKIMDDVGHYLEFARNHSTGEVLYHFLKRSGFLGKLAAEESNENETRLKNLAAFFDKVRRFKEVAVEDKVSEFVKYLNILKEAGENPEASQPDTETDAVNIMTIHKAKGLEFPVVFMCSLVAEKFPVRIRREAIRFPDDLIKEELPTEDFHLQEERRLFYVGMTRARDELFLTSSIDYGGKRERKISQFVLEALDLPRPDVTTIRTRAIDQIELFVPQEISFPPLKKIRDEEILPLSFYLIDDYLTCPLKYKYVHVVNIPLLPSHAIMYGAAVHKAVQAYFSAKLAGQKSREKDLLTVFKHNWSSEGFISRQHEETRFREGAAALKRFFKTQERSKAKVKFVEEEFKFVRDKIQIRGRWDLVLEEKGSGVKGQGSRVRGQEAGISIVDFKTSEVKKQEDADRKTKDNLQLSIYALSWLEKYGTLPERLKLYFIDSGLVGSVSKTARDLDKVWEKIKKVADGIREADFKATPSSRTCGYCPYNEMCPRSAV